MLEASLDVIFSSVQSGIHRELGGRGKKPKV